MDKVTLKDLEEVMDQAWRQNSAIKSNSSNESLLHDSNLVSTMPKEICDKKLDMLVADCHGKCPKVQCNFCHICCEGLPNTICVDQKIVFKMFSFGIVKRCWQEICQVLWYKYLLGGCHNV